MTQMIDEDFAHFFEKKGFGPAVCARDPEESKLLRFKGKVPDKLIEYWRAYGFAGYGEGLFWMTDPDEYSGVLRAWLEGTEFEGRDSYYVIGRSAFGELKIWGAETGNSLRIVSPWAMIFPRDESKDVAAGDGDFLIANWLSGQNKEWLDEEDEDKRPLFARAVKSLGPLASDEMYGFVPALVMGGARQLSGLRKVKAVEHLMFLAKLGGVEVMLDIVKEAKGRGLW